MDWIILAHGRD